MPGLKVDQWAELRGAKCRAAQQGLLDQLEELTLHLQSHADPRAEGRGSFISRAEPGHQIFPVISSLQPQREDQMGGKQRDAGRPNRRALLRPEARGAWTIVMAVEMEGSGDF